MSTVVHAAMYKSLHDRLGVFIRIINEDQLSAGYPSATRMIVNNLQMQQASIQAGIDYRKSFYSKNPYFDFSATALLPSEVLVLHHDQKLRIIGVWYATERKTDGVNPDLEKVKDQLIHELQHWFWLSRTLWREARAARRFQSVACRVAWHAVSMLFIRAFVCCKRISML